MKSLDEVGLIQGRYSVGWLVHAGWYGDSTPTLRLVSDRGVEATLTVSMPDLPANGCVWLKGWAENEGLPEALVAAGVVELTGRKQPTGHVEAVEARLLVEVID